MKNCKFVMSGYWKIRSVCWEKKGLKLILGPCVLHLIRTITRTHNTTRATSLMCVKNSTGTLTVWSTAMKKMKERTKTSNLIVNHFSLILVNLLLAWMLYFYVWLQNKRKFLVWSEYYNQFGIYQPSGVFLLEPWQSNLLRGILRTLSSI